MPKLNHFLPSVRSHFLRSKVVHSCEYQFVKFPNDMQSPSSVPNFYSSYDLEAAGPTRNGSHIGLPSMTHQRTSSPIIPQRHSDPKATKTDLLVGYEKFFYFLRSTPRQRKIRGLQRTYSMIHEELYKEFYSGHINSHPVPIYEDPVVFEDLAWGPVEEVEGEAKNDIAFYGDLAVENEEETVAVGQTEEDDKEQEQLKEFTQLLTDLVKDYEERIEALKRKKAYYDEQIEKYCSD